MIVKFGEKVLVIKEVLPQEDAFEYYLLYDSNRETIFAKKEEEKANGSASRKFTTKG